MEYPKAWTATFTARRKVIRTETREVAIKVTDAQIRTLLNLDPAQDVNEIDGALRNDAIIEIAIEEAPGVDTPWETTGTVTEDLDERDMDIKETP